MYQILLSVKKKFEKMKKKQIGDWPRRNREVKG